MTGNKEEGLIITYFLFNRCLVGEPGSVPGNGHLAANQT